MKSAMIEEHAWLSIHAARTRQDLRTLELVLAARGIESRIEYRNEIWHLVVADDDLAAAHYELAAYQRENVPTAPPPLPARIDSGRLGVVGYLAIVWLIMALEASAALGWDWRSVGRLHVGAVLSGEVWRLFTALTLHANMGHIVANSVFGSLFGALAGRYLGSGLAWLCIVAGGALGNAVNVLVRPASFMSIGASTATFAAVGVLSAFLWRSGYFQQFAGPRRQRYIGAGQGALRRLRPFAPVFAAVALFAYTGIGDENTDVVAHLAGLAVGFLLGLWVAHTRLQLAGTRAQWFFGAVAAASVLAAWLLAG